MDAKGFKKTITAFFVFSLIFFSFSLSANGALPVAPAGLTAIQGNAEASLTWTAVSGATDYVLYRGTVSGGPYSFIAQTQGTGHTNRSISNGTPYYYVVTALNADGQSPYSPPVSVTPTPTVLKAPDGITAIPGKGEVSLTWNPVTSAVSYNVLRGTSQGGPYTLLTPAATGPSFTDRELTNGTPYFYVVQTMSTNLGAYSEEVGATPSALLPPAPTNFIASPGSTWADLSWNSSDGALSYAVYRGVNDGGPYSFEAQPNTPAYEDTNLTNGTTYYYVVAAVNAQGRGAFSAQASAPVSANEKPHAALISTATVGDHTAYICWGQPPGAVSYTVHRSTTSGGPYESLGIKGSCYSDTGLTNGIAYYYVVDTHNGSATIARSNEVAVTPAAQLPTPGNVVVVAGNTQATVTWDPVVGEGNYHVTVATSPGGAAVSGSGSPSGPSYNFTGLTNGQIYYFRVQSYTAAPSAYSAEVSATPLATLPLAPTGLGLTPGNTQMSLTWTAVSGATGYKVYRKTEGSAWPAAPVGTSTGTLFTDTGLVNGTKYYYSVAAVNANGTGAWSNGVDNTPTANMTLAPTNVAVVAGNTQATVTWDPVVGAINYHVIVATSPGGQAISSYCIPSGPSCTLTGLTNGQIYYFRVHSYSTPSAYSAEVSATPLVTLPLAPTGLGLTPGNTQMSLTWTAVSGATGYKVYRKTEGSAWPSAPIGTSTGTLFTDTGLVNGRDYYYSVAAVNANGTGTWSNEVFDTPAVTMTLAPINVAVVAGNTQATVTWDPVVGAINYQVIVATSPGGQAISSGIPSGPSYNATGLTNGQIYYFRVHSYSTPSAYSAEVSATPLVTLPLAPTGLGLTPGNTQMSLTWAAVSGATSYKIYRKTEGSAWLTAPVGTSTGTLFTDTGLVAGTKYYYRVAAVNAGGTGACSSEVNSTPAITSLLAPTNVAVVAGNTQVMVTWDPIEGATAYYVAVATSPGGAAASGSGSSSGPSYNAKSLTNGQTYYFRVRVSSPSGSAYSAEASATPSSPPDTGTITGRVSVNIAGSSNLAVQNATVALLGTAYSTQTDYNGNFILPNVPFADYKLVISAPNMETLTKDITLSGQNLPVTIPQMAVSSPDCLPGDANGDKQVGLDDVIYILQMLTRLRP